jgi:hypothetical protein
VLLPAPGGPVMPITGMKPGVKVAKKLSTPATSFSIEEITLAIELKLPSATSFFKFSIWNI